MRPVVRRVRERERKQRDALGLRRTTGVFGRSKNAPADVTMGAAGIDSASVRMWHVCADNATTVWYAVAEPKLLAQNNFDGRTPRKMIDICT